MVTAVAASLLAFTLGGCGDDRADAPPRSTTSTTVTTVVTVPPVEGTSVLDPAVESGVAYLAAALPTMDAASLMILDYLHREYGLAGLAGARPAAEARLAAPDLADDEVILARLADPDASPPADALEDTTATTQALGVALQCDRRELPDGYFDRLDELAANGGYDATHAALAVRWMADLGCTSDELAATTDVVVDAIAHEFAARTGVSDLAVEQSATLCLLDACDRVPAGWADDVRAARNDDGGWGASASNWHMTMLAVWTLEALRGAGTGAPMVAPG